MADQAADKVVIMATHGPEDKERATLPFVMATASQLMECDTVVILQAPASCSPRRACTTTSSPVACRRSRASSKGSWRRAASCSSARPCIQERQLEEPMLVEGAELIAGARVIQEATTASAVLKLLRRGRPNSAGARTTRARSMARNRDNDGGALKSAAVVVDSGRVKATLTLTTDKAGRA